MNDVACYRLDKAAFQEILQSRPEIAEGVATILAERRLHLHAGQEDLDVASREYRMEQVKG